MPEQQRNCTKKDGSFEWRLTAYAAGAGAVLAMADAADAAIIYSGPQNVPVGVNGSYALDLNGDGTTDYTFAQTYTSSTATSTLTVTPKIENGLATSVTPGQPLNAGTDIASATFTSSGDATAYTLASITSGAGSGPFYGVSNKYLGVQFYSTVPAANSDYGWVELSVTGGTDPSMGPTAVIEGWAYQNDGTTLAAGETPEPGPLALLALGAAGVATLRPRRTRRAVAGATHQGPAHD